MGERVGRKSGSAATIRDVAQAAGVSPMTVSRVINGDPKVRAETRAIVDAAVTSLSYAPNPAARALAGAGRIRIGLLHRFPNSGYLGEYLVGLLDETARAHISLIVRKVAGSREDHAAVEELADAGTRGVILPPPLADDADLVAMLRLRGITIVATGATRAQVGLPSVGIDERLAACEMTAHLIALGHRRIGFISGDAGHASTELRHQGFDDAFESANLPIDPMLVARGLYTYRSGLDAAEGLLGLADRPTAIFASNDDMAAATIAAAHRRRIDVPRQLSVCGFDDSALATAVWPELTTIRAPIAETAARAVVLLARLIAGEPVDKAATTERLTHELVLRASDASPS